jgi:hypothetical protein
MSRGIRLGLGIAATVASVAAVTVVAAAGIAYQKTTSFAGYDFFSSKVTVVSARFTVPKVRCKSDLSGVGPGAFVVDDFKGVIKGKVTTETGLTGSGLIVACLHNVPSYQLATAVNGSEINSAFVKAGHDILVEVHVTAKSSSVAIRDLSATLKETQTGKGATSSYVSIGTAAILVGKQQVGIDQFTPVTFTDVSVQGRSLSWWKPYAVERYRVADHKQVIQIRPGAITHAGQSFTLGFVKS